MTPGVLIRTSINGKEKFMLFFGRLPVFSNFYLSPFILEGKLWRNTEQYFQYEKAEQFDDVEAMRKILQTPTPDEQKKLGRKVKNYDDRVWSKIREDVMLKASIAKFQQNVEDRGELFKTIGTELVEANPYDEIWGIGLGLRDPKALDRKLWKGQNLLGEVLMRCRRDLALNPAYVEEIETPISEYEKCAWYMETYGNGIGVLELME